MRAWVIRAAYFTRSGFTQTRDVKRAIEANPCPSVFRSSLLLRAAFYRAPTFALIIHLSRYLLFLKVKRISLVIYSLFFSVVILQ